MCEICNFLFAFQFIYLRFYALIFLNLQKGDLIQNQIWTFKDFSIKDVLYILAFIINI